MPTFPRRIALTLFAALLAAGPVLAKPKSISKVPLSHDITWTDHITLTPPDGAMGRYPRILKLTQGPDAGDILLTYQTGEHHGDFMMYRSSDQGRTWADPVLIHAEEPGWDQASCNIIELSDGRLIMSIQRRVEGSNLGRDYY